MNKVTTFLVFILAVIILGGVYFLGGDISEVIITNFEECASDGNPVMESYPRQCRHGDLTFTENIGNELEKMDLIRIDAPRPNQIIESPLTIKGQARGTWFFEGDFPVILTDRDGKIIAEGFASASGEWMTEDFVSFSAVLLFEKSDIRERGTLVLQKDNPSGLPENDDALEIPVLVEGNDIVGILPFESGVSGRVLLGPTCPVMRDPPDPACADKPYKTTVQVIAINSPKGAPFATVDTDKDGWYKVVLPPGEYALQPIGGTPLPRCDTKNITIEPDIMHELNLSCDTGIR